MTDTIIIVVIAIVLGLAISSIVKQKKAGVKCIGCSFANQCSGNCSDKENPLVKMYKEDQRCDSR